MELSQSNVNETVTNHVWLPGSRWLCVGFGERIGSELRAHVRHDCMDCGDGVIFVVLYPLVWETGAVCVCISIRSCPRRAVTSRLASSENSQF